MPAPDTEEWLPGDPAAYIDITLAGLSYGTRARIAWMFCRIALALLLLRHPDIRVLGSSDASDPLEP